MPANLPNTDLPQLASDLVLKGPHKLEPSPKRIRVLFNRTYVADATASRHPARLVWEHRWYPVYYLPREAFQPHVLTKADGQTLAHADDGTAAFLGRLTADGVDNERILIFENGPLDGLVRLEFGAMDAWFEEESQIYVHPRDPYKRVDILPSTRKVRVEVDGTVVAESVAGGMFLFETGLPTRYYLPRTAADWALLSASETVTACPYKGEANYYHVTVNGKEYKDLVWWYRYPTPESIAVAGMMCFYNEKVDIWIDGVKEETPKSSPFG